MKKEKIHLEYLLNATSKNILWGAISTPTGLEDWFADKVISDDKIVEFHCVKYAGEHRGKQRLLPFALSLLSASVGRMMKTNAIILKSR